jgi:hypothetical protein
MNDETIDYIQTLARIHGIQADTTGSEFDFAQEAVAAEFAHLNDRLQAVIAFAGAVQADAAAAAAWR